MSNEENNNFDIFQSDDFLGLLRDSIKSEIDDEGKVTYSLRIQILMVCTGLKTMNVNTSLSRDDEKSVIDALQELVQSDIDPSEKMDMALILNDKMFPIEGNRSLLYLVFRNYDSKTGEFLGRPDSEEAQKKKQ